MFSDRDASCVIIEGTLYPKVRAWDRWVHRQEWLCHLGLHYFLPAGRRPGFSVMLCVCARCGYSTWWNGNIWQLQIHLGYWKQAGHAIPVWTGDKQIKQGGRLSTRLPRL